MKHRHNKGSARQPNLVAQLDALYRRIPEVHCKGLCTAACGIIGMQEFEFKRIANRLGHDPTAEADGVCSMLTDEGRCSVYTIRPLVCRLYGAVRKMRCPHGCEPDRWVPAEEAEALMQEAVRIAGGPVLVQIKGLNFTTNMDGLAKGPPEPNITRYK